MTKLLKNHDIDRKMADSEIISVPTDHNDSTPISPL